MPAQAPPGPRPRAPTRPGRTPLPAARPSGRDRPAAKPGHAGRKTSMSDRPSGASDYNTKIIEEFRANEGRVGGPWAGAALILIHHIGANSGTERVSPVGYFPQGEGRFAIVASNGGSPAHPDWYYNLKAHPRITVKVGTQTFTVLAEKLGRARPADVAGRSVAWQVRYAAGVRPRKAASRSLGPAVAAAVTGAANRGGRPLRGTSTGAITSRALARAGG